MCADHHATTSLWALFSVTAGRCWVRGTRFALSHSGTRSSSPRDSRRLVDREARNVCCKFEEHTARLSEIDRPEVVPLHYWRHAEMLSNQLVPLLLVLIILRPESDMMHTARSKTTVADVGIYYDIEMIAQRVTGGREA